MSYEPVQVPTVGRIVHFQNVIEDSYDAAIVTQVHDDLTVDLTIFPPGEIRFATVVAFDSTRRRPGTWSWPARK